jgi:hypothetical protein
MVQPADTNAAQALSFCEEYCILNNQCKACSIYPLPITDPPSFFQFQYVAVDTCKRIIWKGLREGDISMKVNKSELEDFLNRLRPLHSLRPSLSVNATNASNASAASPASNATSLVADLTNSSDVQVQAATSDIKSKGNKLIAQAIALHDREQAAREGLNSTTLTPKEILMQKLREKARTLLHPQFESRMQSIVAERVTKLVPDELAMEVARKLPRALHEFKMKNTGMVWGEELAQLRRHITAQLKVQLMPEVQARVTKEVTSEEETSMDHQLDVAVDARVGFQAEIILAQQKAGRSDSKDEPSVALDANSADEVDPVQHDNEVLMLQDAW